MSRKRYIQDPVTLELIEVQQHYRPPVPVSPMLWMDLPEYESPIDGRPISGRKQRAWDLARSGCRPYEGRDSEMREAVRQREYAERDLMRGLTGIAERAYAQLPPEKRRILERSL